MSDNSDEDPHYEPESSTDTDDLSKKIEEELVQPKKNQKRKKTAKKSEVRKRLRNENDWIDNKAKRELNFGVKHQNRKGVLVPERKIEASCKDTCRLKCKNRLNDEQRKNIFQQFWQLGDHTRQWDFIARFVTTEAKKQVTIKNRDSRRNLSRKYNFSINGETARVCKKMFLNTLGISEQWVTTALSRVTSEGTLKKDSRGMHTSRANKITQEVIESVKKHIELFPVVPSHYVRKKSTKMYLEEGLGISKMYRLYLDYIKQENNTSVATARQYRDIFNTKFNISFHKPKKDRCETCSSFEMADDNGKAKMLEKYNKHIYNKDLARSLKDRDKELIADDQALCVACFDLQKVLQTPQSEVGEFYYKSKISVYNFTVYDLGTHEGFCYVWTELTAKRGPNEISSCLLKFLKVQAEKKIKRVILYSDNCGGQNRNRFIFAMFSYASQKFGIEIVHRFLEKGHTQNEGDTMHAVIENARKRLSSIYTPDQWVSLIRMAKVTGKPYIVTEMNQNSFFSFSNIVKYQNWKKSTTGKKVYISQIKETRYLPQKMEEVLFKYEHEGDSELLSLRPNTETRRSSASKLSTQDLPKLYTKTLGIDAKKLKGLMQLCQKGVIPKMYLSFYNSLKVQEAVEKRAPRNLTTLDTSSSESEETDNE